MKDKRNSNWALQEWADFNLCEQFTSYHYLTRIRLGIKDIKAELWLLQKGEPPVEWKRKAEEGRKGRVQQFGFMADFIFCVALNSSMSS